MTSKLTKRSFRSTNLERRTIRGAFGSSGADGVPILILAILLVSACATDHPIPSWFDAVHRIPIRSVEVDGHRIAYLDRGQGPPVILVHGLGGSMWQWEYQQAPLASAHRVITMDLLGSGYSDKPDLDYRPDEIIASLRGFMDALKIERASLVGNSLGGGVVAGLALTHPDRVDRLVLIAGLPNQVRESLGDTFLKRAVNSRAPVWLVQLGNWIAGRGLTRSVLSEVVHDDRLLTPLVIDRAYRNRQHPGLIPPLIALTRNLPLWENGLAQRLSQIRHPTLLVWGEHDRVFPAAVGRRLQGMIPDSRLVLIPEAGHIPQWERPDAVNPALLEFLRP